jgi:hypothetical protein
MAQALSALTGTAVPILAEKSLFEPLGVTNSAWPLACW